jgi:hypothetical protein
MQTMAANEVQWTRIESGSCTESATTEHDLCENPLDFVPVNERSIPPPTPTSTAKRGSQLTYIAM